MINVHLKSEDNNKCARTVVRQHFFCFNAFRSTQHAKAALQDDTGEGKNHPIEAADSEGARVESEPAIGAHMLLHVFLVRIVHDALGMQLSDIHRDDRKLRRHRPKLATGSSSLRTFACSALCEAEE